MPLSPEDFEAAIYEDIADRAAAQERTFFHKFVEGQLSREGLKEYYRHLYHECTHFVRLVSGVHAMSEHRDQREVVAQNFIEEYGSGVPGQDHPSLAKHIGTCLGLTEAEIEAHGVYPEVNAAFQRLKALALTSYIEGLAILVTIEADLPVRHTLMRNALINYYGLRAEDLKYYDEHRSGDSSTIQDDTGYGGDDVHVVREVKLLAKYARSDAEQQSVRDAIAAAFEARCVVIKALDTHCGSA